MLDAFKQLVGLAPRDNREVWHEKPLVIIDADNVVVFSGRATIEYTPSPQAYEKGHADVYDASDGALFMSAEIVGQQQYSFINQSSPFRTRYRLGLTAKAEDKDGRHFTFFVGRHAQTYLLRGVGSVLDYTADTTTMPFTEESEDEPEA